ncbi:MAG: FG-GAP-like repeat-containing protein [Planctomycetota bacterium]
MDWDEDGDFDLLSGEYNGKVMLFRNIGTPTNPSLTSGGYIKLNSADIDVGSLSCPEINDWNEDGLKDLIVGSDAGQVFVYLNSGTPAAPVFRSSFKIKANGAEIMKIKNCPRIADMNEDGLKDLILSWIDGTCLYWPNYGTNAAPEFHESYSLTGYRDNTIDPNPGAYNWSHFGICDWDEDGYTDLLYTRWESEMFIHLSGAHLLECEIEADSSPAVVPPGGGPIAYQLSITNNSTEDAVLDVWVDITLPDGTPYGPVRTVGTGLTLSAGATQNFAFEDDVPGTFEPSSDYAFALYLGEMGNGYFATSHFSFTKRDHLYADAQTLSETGGSVNFALDAGLDHASRNYLLVGGVTGTAPGYPLPGGLVTLPVNFDVFTYYVVFPLMNTPTFQNFTAALNAEGQAAATLYWPGPSMPPGSVGIIMYYAYCLGWPWEFASNAVEVEIVP